ncbi:MAG: hypothetical protein ABI367_06870 [Mucilaginibacter sp.]
MTKPIKTIMIALLAVMFTSCTAIRDAVDSGKAVNLSALKIGMTKADVQTALNKKPDNIIAAKKYPETNTVVEVVQYTKWGDANAGIANAPQVWVPLERYWLYFINDKLDKWEIASPDRRPRI